MADTIAHRPDSCGCPGDLGGDRLDTPLWFTAAAMEDGFWTDWCLPDPSLPTSPSRELPFAPSSAC